MALDVGSIVDGKVTGITKFGAFVSLPDSKSGLVHISEIANTYVNDIHEHLKEGQEIKVKIIDIDKEGRYNLSIKKAIEPTARPVERRNTSPGERSFRKPKMEPQNFEDRLKLFMQESESKISDLKSHTDKRNGSRRAKQK